MAMLIKKCLSLWTDVNFVIVPDQNNLTWNQVKQMLQKSNDMHRAKTALMRMNSQPNPPHVRTDQKRAKKIQALMVIETGAHGRCLSTW